MYSDVLSVRPQVSLRKNDLFEIDRKGTFGLGHSM